MFNLLVVEDDDSVYLTWENKRLAKITKTRFYMLSDIAINNEILDECLSDDVKERFVCHHNNEYKINSKGLLLINEVPVYNVKLFSPIGFSLNDVSKLQGMDILTINFKTSRIMIRTWE